MAGGEPSSTAGVGGGVLDLPGANQSYRDDLQARTNTLGALPRRGNEAGYRAHGATMASGSASRCYGVLGHHLTIQGHGKTEKLTVSRLEGSATSRKTSRGRFVVGGGWREKERAR